MEGEEEERLAPNEVTSLERALGNRSGGESPVPDSASLSSHAKSS